MVLPAVPPMTVTTLCPASRGTSCTASASRSTTPPSSTSDATFAATGSMAVVSTSLPGCQRRCRSECSFYADVKNFPTLHFSGMFATSAAVRRRMMRSTAFVGSRTMSRSSTSVASAARIRSMDVALESFKPRPKTLMSTFESFTGSHDQLLLPGMSVRSATPTQSRTIQI